METKLQNAIIDNWAKKQIESMAHHPEAQKQVSESMPGQVELLKKVVGMGWELIAPSYPIIDWRAFKPSADAPKKVEVWKFSPDALLAECSARDNEAPKCHTRACCEKAVLIRCVCDCAWSCPEHGSAHHGTHD